MERMFVFGDYTAEEVQSALTQHFPFRAVSNAVPHIQVHAQNEEKYYYDFYAQNCRNGEYNRTARLVKCLRDSFSTASDENGAGFPARRDLAQWILGQNLRGKTFLDIGTTSGVLAMAAVMVGAKVMAAEGHATNCFVTESNFRRNGINRKIDATTTLRKVGLYFHPYYTGEAYVEYLKGFARPDIVATADTFYDQAVSEPLQKVLLHWAKQGAQVLVADSAANPWLLAQGENLRLEGSVRPSPYGHKVFRQLKCG